MQVQSKVIIRESFSFHIPPQQIHHFSPLLLYDISVYHLFFRTAYHKPIGKSTFFTYLPGQKCAVFDCHFSLPVPAVYRPVLPPSPAGGVPCRGAAFAAAPQGGAAAGGCGDAHRPGRGHGPLSDGLPDLLHRRGRAGVPCVHGCDAVHRGPYRPGGVSLGAESRRAERWTSPPPSWWRTP